MPASASSDSISFSDYFNNGLPPFEDFPRQLAHLSTSMEKYVTKGTKFHSTRVLMPIDIDLAESKLASFPSVKEPILQVQAFQTEQDVSDAFHSHVLAKVVPALATCLETFYKDGKSQVINICRKNEYRIYQVPEVRIKANENSIDTQQRHSDNVVFFAPIQKICDTEAKEEPPIVVVSPKNFKQSLIEATKAEKGIWPVLALFVVEAKAAGIVDGTRWDIEDDAISTKNREVIAPQLRLYSSDACCEYVFLTDYLKTVLFRVKDNGLETPNDGTHQHNRTRNRASGSHGVMHIENSFNDGARALLFATGLKVLRRVLQVAAWK